VIKEGGLLRDWEDGREDEMKKTRQGPWGEQRLVKVRSDGW
jgi:hypothetical protein